MTTVLMQLFLTHGKKAPLVLTKSTKSVHDVGTIPLSVIQSGYHGDERDFLTKNAAVFKKSPKENTVTWAKTMQDAYKKSGTTGKVFLTLFLLYLFVVIILVIMMYVGMWSEGTYVSSFMALGAFMMMFSFGGLYVVIFV